MEPVLKIWYDGLKEGKLKGLKCKSCGKIMFPPFPVCSECGGMDTEWVEISGKGKLFSMGYSPSGIPGYVDDPVVMGFVELEEGGLFNATIKGMKKKQIDEVAEKLPVPITLGIQEMDDKVSYPCICLDEEQKD